MTSLLLIGCGNMGSALLARWVDAFAVTVVEPNEVALPKNVSQAKQLSDLPQNFSPEIIVLAVKPQSLEEILPAIAKRFGNTPTYLSIAAGKTIAFFEQHLGQGAGVVRAMPNTPAMIGQGMTVLCQNGAVSPIGHNHATALMNAVGETLWLEDEKLMDAVTAISGSGPAYYYIYMAALVEAAVKQGLAPEIAEKLVIQTAIGASHMASVSGEGLCTLIQNVTSPNGTTDAARAVLEKDNVLQSLISEAVAAAVKRAKEL